MIPRVVRSLGLLATTGIGLAACDTTEPGPDAVVYETARFRIVDFTSAPDELIDALSARLEAEYDRVGELLPEFDPPETPVAFNLLPGPGLHYTTASQNSISQWRDDLAPEYITHQLAHLYTRYQQTEFIEEGIAVYVTEELQLDGEAPRPFRLQALHAWTALFQQHQSIIPLITAFQATNLGYDYDGSSIDASSWQLFVEAGSFTRWMIETYGRVPWHQFYLTGDAPAVLGQDLSSIQVGWLGDVVDAHPDPEACEDALGTVGTREMFWCARARGE